MALTLGITIKSYNNVIKNLEATNEDASMQGAAGNVRFSIAQLIMFANDYIITEKDYYRQMFEQQRMRVEDYQKKLRMFCSSSREIAIVDSIAANVDSINVYAHRIFAVSKPRYSSEAAALMEIMDYKFGDVVSRKTTEIFDIVFSRIEELRIQSARSKEQMLNTIYTVFSLALLVSLAFVYLSVQRIVKPIKAVVKAADAIAKGDYTQRPVVKTHDEIALLAGSFNVMAESIQHAQKALEESKRLTEAIVATVPVGLLVFDAEGKILTVNNSFCDIFGLNSNVLVGQNIEPMFEKLKAPEECLNHILTRDPVRNVECTYSDPVKGSRTINLTIFPIRLTGRESLLIIEDITKRKHNEQIVIDSEKHFRALIENSTDGLIIISADGTLLYESPASARIVGYAYGELLNKNVFALIHPDDFVPTMDIHAKLLEQPSTITKTEFRFQHKDGTWRWIDLTAKNSLHDTTIGGIVINFRDITERRIAEEMIKKSEDLLRTTLYSIGDAVITTDEHGIVQRLNPVAEHLTGWKESEAQGKPIEYIFNIINEETYNKVENPVQKVLREGVVVGLANHTLLISKYGREVPIADSGAPIKNETGSIVGVVLVFRDQTEEREKRKALELSHLRLKEAQRMAHIGNWELDLQKNELYWCDEIFCIFEIDPAEFGASYEAFLNLVHPDERESVNDAYTNSVKNKTPYSIDHRLLMKDGRIKYVHEQCETYYDDQGHPIHSVGTVQDITEHKREEEVLRESEEKFKTLVEDITDIFYEVNVQGKIIYGSPNLFTATGYAPQEILGKRYFFLVAPEDRRIVVDHYFTQAASGVNDTKCEFRAIRKDGTRIWAEQNTRIVRDTDGRVLKFRNVVRDVTERKRAEEALAEREKRYRALFNLSPSGIILEDVEGNIVEVNEASCKSLGYSQEELVGSNVRMVASPEEIPGIENHIALLRSGKTLQHVVENVRKDGTRCWMELYETLILLPDGREGFLVVAHDISERKRAEEERFRLAQVLESSLNEIYMFDPETLHFSYVNFEARQNLGYSLEQLRSLTPLDIKPEYTDTSFREIILRPLVLAEKKVHVFETVHRRANGTEYPVEVHLQMVESDGIRSFVAFIHDITERKRAEEELLKIGTAIEQTADCVVITDRNGIIQYVNTAFTKITGYSKEEAIGKTSRILKSGLHPPQFFEALWKTILSGEVFRATFINKRKDGELIYEIKTITPIKDKEGNITHFVSTAKEITEQRRAEEAMRKKEEHHKAVIENIFKFVPEGVLVLTESLNLLKQNKAFEDIVQKYATLLGYTEQELAEKIIEQLRSRIVSGDSNQPEADEPPAQEMYIGKKDQLETDPSGRYELILQFNTARMFLAEEEEEEEEAGIVVSLLDITERKRAEEELLKIGTAVEQTADCVVITDRDGIIQYVNTAFLKIFGYSKEEVLGKTPKFIKSGLHPPEFFQALWKTILSGEVFTATFINKRKDGELVYEIKTITPIKDKEGNITHFVSTAKEITEQRRAEEEIISQKNRFEQLFENSPIAIVLLDDQDKVAFINESFSALFGYYIEEIRGKFINDLIVPPELREEAETYTNEALSGNQINKESYRRKKDGTLVYVQIVAVPVIVNDKTVGLYGMYVNLTERKDAEDAVKESEEKFRKLAETANDSIVISDSKGKIISWNKSAERTFGYTFEEMNGKDIQTIIPRKHKLLHKESFNERVSGREPKLFGKAIAIEAVRKDETVFPIELSLSSWESNNLFYYTAIIKDITERVNAEQELETYRNHLEELVRKRTEELDKANESLKKEIEKEKEIEMMLQQSLEKEKELNEMKSRFISTTSHEFRTPLTSVLSSAELLQKYAAKWSDDKKNQHLNRIQKSVDYLTKLLDGVLTLSRTETGKKNYNPEPVDLRKFAEECTEDVKSLMTAQHELKLSYKTSQKKFNLDTKLLKFIFNNMLSNAVKYSPEGGKIGLKISTNKKYLIMEVSDNGIGIATEELGKIFESFYRTKNSGTISGTGLGLAIVKRAVELHNGEITVSSEINKGTTFVIKIPKN